MAITFKARIKVRFSDCDIAGIVFYPRYLEMINCVVEDWLENDLKWSFSYIHHERMEGLPTISTNCQFFSPSRMGDVLEFELKVIRLGNSSLTLSIVANNNGKTVFEAINMLVYITLASNGCKEKSMQIPELLKERMLPYIATEVR